MSSGFSVISTSHLFLKHTDRKIDSCKKKGTTLMLEKFGRSKQFQNVDSSVDFVSLILCPETLLHPSSSLHALQAEHQTNCFLTMAFLVQLDFSLVDPYTVEMAALEVRD